MFQSPCSSSPPLPRERTCCQLKPFERAAKSVGLDPAALLLQRTLLPLGAPQPENDTVLPEHASQLISGEVHKDMLKSIMVACASPGVDSVPLLLRLSSICSTLSVAARKERVESTAPAVLACALSTNDLEMFCVAIQPRGGRD